MATEVLMPRQGQSVESCIIIDWKVAEGDSIEAGEIICDIETDKAAFEVESPASGTVLGIFYPVDADVEVLKVIAAIGEPGEDVSSLRPENGGVDDVAEMPAAGQASAAAVDEAQAIAHAGQQPQAAEFSGRSSPRARKLGARKGVDLSQLTGSGPHGRVIERDVIAARPVPVSPAAQQLASAEGIDLPEQGSGIGGRVLAADLSMARSEGIANVVAAMDFPGAVEEIPVRGVRKLVAERMRSSLQNTAQLTHHASADARAVLAYRKKCKAAPEAAGLGGVSINHIVMFAAVKTLLEMPEFNAHWQGDRIMRFKDVHLGMAVDTERGLMVPVIRYASRMNLRQLAAEAGRLAQACIGGAITPDELSGGTFTVSTLGALGIEAFTPVINTPEVGILGVCSVQAKPVIHDDEVEFIPHMGLSLTFDHQAVDGAPAARFLAILREKLAAFELTLA
jgi:pyruvate dehydrogenase E2 component (dihydrolipoamide acetyltransferase)